MVASIEIVIHANKLQTGAQFFGLGAHKNLTLGPETQKLLSFLVWGPILRFTKVYTRASHPDKK